MGLEVGAYNIMASEVECSSNCEAFGHANTRDEDGSRAEGCITSVLFANGVMVAEEGRDRIAEEKNKGGKRENRQGDENEGCVLSKVKVIG